MFSAGRVCLARTFQRDDCVWRGKCLTVSLVPLAVELIRSKVVGECTVPDLWPEPVPPHRFHKTS